MRQFLSLMQEPRCCVPCSPACCALIGSITLWLALPTGAPAGFKALLWLHHDESCHCWTFCRAALRWQPALPGESSDDKHLAGPCGSKSSVVVQAAPTQTKTISRLESSEIQTRLRHMEVEVETRPRLDMKEKSQKNRTIDQFLFSVPVCFYFNGTVTFFTAWFAALPDIFNHFLKKTRLNQTQSKRDWDS